uniref:Uncharacterized protein n=1 Tax=Tetraselmis sp. GSL018 TaxID=582737 RepID=A0A061SNE1_9CHLO
MLSWHISVKRCHMSANTAESTKLDKPTVGREQQDANIENLVNYQKTCFEETNTKTAKQLALEFATCNTVRLRPSDQSEALYSQIPANPIEKPTSY